MKTVQIKLWEKVAHVPYDVIAKHKARTYEASVDEIMIDFDNDHYEAVEWLQNNMILEDFIDSVQFWANKWYDMWYDWVNKIDQNSWECLSEKSVIQILNYVEHCAKKFIDKVDQWKAKSVETYNDMQEIVRLISWVLK